MGEYEYRCSECGNKVIAHNTVKWPLLPPLKGREWRCKVYRIYDCPRCGYRKDKVS